MSLFDQAHAALIESIQIQGIDPFHAQLLHNETHVLKNTPTSLVEFNKRKSSLPSVDSVERCRMVDKKNRKSVVPSTLPR